MFFSLVLEYPWLVVLSRRCGAWTGNGVYCGQDCGYCKRTRAVLSSGCPHYYKINLERRLCPLTQSVPGLSVTPSFSLDIYISLSILPLVRILKTQRKPTVLRVYTSSVYSSKSITVKIKFLFLKIRNTLFVLEIKTVYLHVALVCTRGYIV